MRRYDDAETLIHRVLARATDDRVRNQANQLLAYITQARDYDAARARQMQEESAARANALASAARSAEAAAARSDEPPAEKIAEPSGPAGDSDAPVLKRRGQPPDVTGVVIQVQCNGNEMEVTAKVVGRPAPLLFRAKDRTRIGYTSNVSAIHNDMEPCSELKGHTAKLVFTPSGAKWLDGELVHIEVEK